jgi:serine protease Do
MRKSLFHSMLILAFAAVAVCSALAASAIQTYVYSDEDIFGGGSYLGVDTRNITPDRVGPLHLKQEMGVEVTMVDQDAPAGKAGIKEHDVILSINGEQVESVEQLRRLIREIPPGRTVSIGISRDGQPLTLKAELADRKRFLPQAKEFKFVVPPIPPIPDIDVPVSIVVVRSSARSGLMVENLTPQLADFFGTKNGQGVLVRSVEKGSLAEKAGFHAGDVIVRINGDTINDAGDFSHALRSHKENENKASVTVIRDKKEQTLTLTLPPRRQSGAVEESFGFPEIGAETRKEIEEARSLAQMLPKEELRNQARMMADQERQVAKGLARHQKELQSQMKTMRRQLEKQKEELRQQLHELLGGKADI